MLDVSKINFQGKFKYEKLKSKQAKNLKEILTTEYNGISAERLLKSMPYDVDVYCMNPTKRAIHPRFSFWMIHTKKRATLNGCVRINSKDSLMKNIEKLNKFITSFDEKFRSLKGDERLSPAEETRKQVDFILFGG